MSFNPNEHLSKLRGKSGDYLEVKWRLVWFRDLHPHGEVGTELIHFDLEKGIAIFKAVVQDGEGGIASGHGSETAKDFGDYLEKAETKAIGRALAALGYGTQFAPELEEGNRIVDAPVVKNAKPEIDEPGVPTVKELQERCAALFGVGYFQSMAMKALQRSEPIHERDLLTEQRARIAKYLDFVEQQKAKPAGEQPAA